MESPGAISILILGFVLGIKHATDADHLIAVSTIVSEKKGFWSSSIVGALWGVGHTASLLVVGLAVVAFHFQIPEKIALAMEFFVAVMLIGLGVNVLAKLRRGSTLHIHEHSHHGHAHVHMHFHAPEKETSHDHAPAVGKKPFLVGMVHGMAGSAALMLIALATISSTTLALFYISLFGVGSILGMFLMSALIGLPFFFSSRNARIHRILRFSSALLSVGFGLFYAWQIGIVEGLFL